MEFFESGFLSFSALEKIGQLVKFRPCRRFGHQGLRDSFVIVADSCASLYMESIDEFEVRPSQGIGIHFAEDNFQALLAEFTSYGLTIRQARLYLYLLGKDPIPARSISSGLGLHRVDVYRNLRELTNFGIVQLFVGSPKKYSAIEPKLALLSLLNRSYEKISYLRRLSADLVSRLQSFEKSRKNTGEIHTKVESAENAYSLVVGADRYYDKVRNLIGNLNDEGLIITPKNELRQIFGLGIWKDYVKAKRRGISLRMITKIEKSNMSYAERLAKIVQLRHLDSIDCSLLVADRSIVLLGANHDTQFAPTSKNSLVLRDPKFATCLHSIFQHLWKVAVASSGLTSNVRRIRC